MSFKGFNLNIEYSLLNIEHLFFFFPLLSAFLFWSAMPPLDQTGNAWFAMVPLILLARFSKPGRAFRLAWLGGFVYWVASLFWFWRLIGNGGPLVLVILAQTVFAAYLALYWGLFAAASARLWQGRATCHAGGCLFLICVAEPLLWVGAEYLRGFMLTGFPWNFLGVMASQNIAAIQLAEYGGVYAVSFLVMLANAGFASMLVRIGLAFAQRLPKPLNLETSLLNLEPLKFYKKFHTAIPLSLVPLLLVLTALFYGVHAINRERLAARADHDVWLAGLVQPNTPSIFQLNDDDDLVPRQRAMLDTLTRQLGVLEPDFILWPESALLGNLPYDLDAMKLAASAARDTGAHILAGCGDISELTKDYRIKTCHNAVWHFTPDGKVAAKYRKQHLVPFGEYIPGSSILPSLNNLTPSGFPCTPGKGPVVFKIEKKEGGISREPLSAGALICFEDLFPYLSRNTVKAGARVLLNATNDAWFEGSLEPEHHKRQSVFRAVENRVYLLRSTATGVTCVVDPMGRVERLMDADGSSVSFAGFLPAKLSIPKNFTPTFYTRHGDKFFALPAAVFLLVVLGGMLVRRKYGILP